MYDLKDIDLIENMAPSTPWKKVHLLFFNVKKFTHAHCFVASQGSEGKVLYSLSMMSIVDNKSILL